MDAYLGCFVVRDVVVEVAMVSPFVATEVELFQPTLCLQAVVQVVKDVEVLLHPAEVEAAATTGHES